MIENIKNLGTNPRLKTNDNGNSDVASSKSSKSSENSAVVTTGDAGVQLSPEAQKLESIKQSILSAPDVDQAKVEQIRDSIANGEYKINFSNLADKMIDSFGNKAND